MNKKLSLNKEVIATLSNDSMNRVKGGDACVTNTMSCTCGGPGACENTAACTGKDCFTQLYCKEVMVVGTEKTVIDP